MRLEKQKVRRAEGEKGRRAEGENMGMNRKNSISHFRDLEVYKRAFEAAMNIFQITKGFPAEEKYSLVDQIRRASRAVCANIAEGWRKRRYVAVFKNKMTDSMQEASETQCWLEFCLSGQYIDQEVFEKLEDEYEQIIAMLNSVERNAKKFCF